MQFQITAYDGTDDGALERRMAARPAHLSNIQKISRHVLCAGGLIDKTGKPIGSFLTMEFEDRAALNEYLKTEPYILQGVWQKVDVQPCNVVIMDGAFRNR